MLYISKCRGKSKYEVIDTDDGVAEVVTYGQVVDAVRSGVDIKGVKCFIKDGVPYIQEVKVYQHQDSMTVRQTKAKVLAGVDIKLHNGEITSFNWVDSIVQPNVRIRLSDYGSKCADGIFETGMWKHKVPIIIVLDDKIKLRRQSLTGACQCSQLKIDVSEVTDIKTLNIVYKELIENAGRMSTVEEYAIDRYNRLEKVAIYGVVAHGHNPGGRVFSQEAIDFLENLLVESFEKLADSPLHFVSYTSARDIAKDHIAGLRRYEKFWRMNSNSYMAVRVHDDLRLLEVLSKTTTVNMQTAGNFLTFLYYFSPPSERVQQAYVKLCNRSNNWYLDLAKEMGWRIRT